MKNKNTPNEQDTTNKTVDSEKRTSKRQKNTASHIPPYEEPPKVNYGNLQNLLNSDNNNYIDTALFSEPETFLLDNSKNTAPERQNKQETTSQKETSKKQKTDITPAKPSYGKQEIGEDDNLDLTGEVSDDDYFEVADNNNDTPEKLDWVDSFLSAAKIVPPTPKQTDSQTQQVPEKEAISFDTLSSTQELSSTQAQIFLSNLQLKTDQDWFLMPHQQQAFYKRKLNAICQSPQHLNQNITWVKFFHALLTFSLTHRLVNINEELFDLEKYLTLSVYLAFMNERSLTDDKTRTVVFLSLQTVLKAGQKVVDNALFATPTQIWQNLSINSWIDFYIQAISPYNFELAVSSLFLSQSPDIFKLITERPFHAVEGNPTLLDICIKMINEDNVLNYFLLALATKDALIIEKILSTNPLTLGYLSKKVNKNNVLDIVNGIILAKNTELFLQFKELKISSEGDEPITVFDCYLSTLKKSEPQKAIKNIRNVLYGRATLPVIEAMFKPSRIFPEGLLDFYLNLDIEQRHSCIRNMLLSRCPSLVQQCISNAKQWTNGKTILTFYIDSLKKPDKHTASVDYPTYILTKLFHPQNPALIQEVIKLNMPEWAGNQTVLDYYFESFQDDLPALVKNIFSSRDSEFIKLCMQKKLHWLKDSPPLEEYCLKSIKTETALETYVESALSSYYSDYIQAMMHLPVPFNKTITIFNWYLSDPRHLVKRMQRILSSGCTALQGEMAKNNDQKFLPEFLGLKIPLPTDGSSLSHLNGETLLSRVAQALSSRVMMESLLQEDETGKTLFLQLLKSYWPAIEDGENWGKLFTKLINTPLVAASKVKLFSEVIGSFPSKQSWLHLLLKNYPLIHQCRQSWLISFLTTFISDRRDACRRCIELLEKESPQDNGVINLSDTEIKQVNELLNAFNNPCFTITSTNNQTQLTLISKQGFEELKKELRFPALIWINLSQNKELLREIFTPIINNLPKSKVKIPRLDRNDVWLLNTTFGGYFNILTKKEISIITIHDKKGCIEIAKELQIEINELRIASSETTTTINVPDQNVQILREVFTAIAHGLPNLKISIPRYNRQQVKELNARYNGYFFIRTLGGVTQLTIFNRVGCIEEIKKLNIEIDEQRISSDIPNNVAPVKTSMQKSKKRVDPDPKTILKEILTGISKLRTKDKILVLDGTFERRFTADFNKQHRGYFKIRNNHETGQFKVTVVDRAACDEKARELGLITTKTAKSKRTTENTPSENGQEIANQPDESNTEHPTQIAPPIIDLAATNDDETSTSTNHHSAINSYQKHNDSQSRWPFFNPPKKTSDSANRTTPQITTTTSLSAHDDSGSSTNHHPNTNNNNSSIVIPCREINEGLLIKDLKYILTAINKTSSTFIGIRASNLVNLDHITILNERYGKYFRLKHDHSLMIEVIDSLACFKLMQEFGMKVNIPPTLLNRTGMVFANKAPNAPTQDFFNSQRSSSKKTEEIITIDDDTPPSPQQ